MDFPLLEIQADIFVGNHSVSIDLHDVLHLQHILFGHNGSPLLFRRLAAKALPAAQRSAAEAFSDSISSVVMVEEL